MDAVAFTRRFSVAAVAMVLFVSYSVYSQEASQEPQTAVTAVNEGGPADPSMSAHQAGVECALAQIAEEAGQGHRPVNNPLDVSFKSGLCAGKLQTFMLLARQQYPSCFPQISLEEGIRIFVTWADAHPEKASEDYLLGFKDAFSEAVPCMKK